MKPSAWSSCALALALGWPAFAQQQDPPIDIAPLVPGKPAPKKAKKPAEKPPETKPEALPPLALPPAQPPVEAELPLAPLEAPRPVQAIGVTVERAGLAEAAVGRVGDSLRAIARLAPAAKETKIVAPQACADDACWAGVAAAQKVDQLALATWAAGTMRVRLIDAGAKKQIAHAEQPVSADPVEAAAASEALLCKLLVPAGCTGVPAIDVGDGVQVELDGRAFAKGEKRALPVGLHDVRLASGTHVATRLLPVLHDGAPVLYARQVSGEPRLLTAAELDAPQAVPAAALATTAPAGERKWTRTAGYVAAGAAIAVAATGAYFGAKSHSEINQAESAFNSNGGAYRAADLATLDSGNSKAHTANALFIASGVLLATAAVFTFAF